MSRMDLDTEKLKNGPVSDRNCTDVICCCVFIIFLVGLAVAWSYAIGVG